MKILHYSPKERGIRFFRVARRYLQELYKDENSISDSKNIYLNFHSSTDFLVELRNRLKYPDIILIMAHGWTDSILKTKPMGYERDITIDKSRLFANDFVFALSCYTAEEFGNAAINNKAITYIGFNDSIESFFEVNGSEYKKLSKKFEIVIKKIYMTCFLMEFKNFIMKCYTAKEFYDFLSIRIDTEITKLIKIPFADFNELFGIKISEKHTEKARKLIKLNIIGKIDEINSRMRLLGEENYVPWFFLSSQNEDKLIEVLEKVSSISENNNNYKYFIKALIHDCLYDEDKYKQSLVDGLAYCQKTGQTFFYYNVFPDREIAAGYHKS